MSEIWVPLGKLLTPQLQQNLSYLEFMIPELHQLAQNALASEALLFQNQEGLIRCRTDADPPQWIFGGENSAKELERIREKIQSAIKGASLVILAGSAAGYAIAEIIPAILSDSSLRVVAVEPSAARIRAYLTLLDARTALDTGRLHFVVGEMSVKGLIEAIRPFHLWEYENVSLYRSPEIAEISEGEFEEHYRKECEIARAQRFAVLASMNPVSHESGRTIERVLLLNCWPGAPGEAHIQAIHRALQARGVKSAVLPFNRYRIEGQGDEYRRLMEPRLLDALEKTRPDLIVSYGYHGHQLAQRDLFAASGAVWLQTVSNIAYYDTEFYHAEHTALIDRHLISIFARRGAPHPFFAPLMADYASPRPMPTNRQFPIVFVGNSLGLSPQAASEFFNRWRGRDGLLDYIKRAETALSAFDPDINLYQTMSAEPPPQIGGLEEEYAVFRYLLCQGSAARRRRLLERIAPLGLVLFGGDWANYLPPDSPLRGCLRGHLPLRDEPKIFSHGHIFVNIHSVGHVTGPNMRFFNAAGMGGFQISDGPEFGVYYEPDSEMIYYRTESEFAERVRYYLAHPQEADEIRERARLRTLRDWTYQRWIDWVCGEIGLQAPPIRQKETL
ncbi:MAG: glycosyltransferase [Candidatus Omnitrophota bacterium]